MAQSRRGRPPNPLDPGASRAARLGAEIRSRRQARGLTLDALAALIGFSAQHLSEAERAKAPVSEPFVAACDHALDARGSLLGLLPAVVYDRATERHERSAARRQAARSGSVVGRGREVLESRAAARNEVEPGIAFEPRSRIQEREKPDAATFQRDTGHSSGPVDIDRVGDPSDERLRYALQHPTTVDLPAVAQLRDRLWDLDVRYVRAPSTSLLADTGRCLSDISFLRAHATESRVRQELCGAEAEAATLMGQLVWDASQRREHAAARAFLHQAIHAARARGNPTAEGRALLRMSMVALYGEKNPKAGLALAAQAVEVTTATSEVIGGLAMLHAAEAHAMLGRRPECDRALSRAGACFDRITATDPAIEQFSPTQLGRLAGSCYLSLGDNRRALSLLQTTAHPLRDGSKAQAIVMGNLAVAQLRLGELDAATYAIHEAIDVIELTRGAGGLNIVFGVAQQLRPWRRLPVVQDVYDRLLALPLREAVEPDKAKQAVRERVWALLERERAAPPDVHGHIPAFFGADAAAELLASLPVWRAARVVKAVPDRAQLPVRAAALAAGKVLYMAVPRLARDKPFYLLDPANLTVPPLEAASADVAATLAKSVSVEEMSPVDVVVCGSVAVNRQGVRLGKGAGYSDIEVALLQEAELIGPQTTIITTVHPLQVVDEPLPETEHDFSVDVIVTTEDVIRCPPSRRPPGILWDHLSSETIAAIPVLAARERTRLDGSGWDPSRSLS